MPLRDRFHSPTSTASSWERVHGQWPAMMVLALNRILPANYVAGPRVHHGAFVEVDVAAYERDQVTAASPAGDVDGGVATAAWAPTQPTLTVETDPPDTDEYEVRIYDIDAGDRLVAAVELVSPANKDRDEHRRRFVAKCAALLHSGVSVAIVDPVTERRANLYRELLDWLGRPESPPASVSPLYAAACRYREGIPRWRFETWDHPLEVGQPLPTLPLWLSDELAVPLELEATYEATCLALRIA